MPVRIGPFDPIQLIFNIINILSKKGLISPQESKEIIINALDPGMSEEDKKKIVDSLFKKAP